MNDHPQRISSRSRRLAVAAGISLVAGVLAIGVGEIIIRVAGFAPDPGLFTVTAHEFARLPGIFAPNQQVVEARGTRFEHTIRIDSLGYRGRDLSRRKPAGEFRVLHVGDSFTFGHNVADDQTTPAQLERQLDGPCGRTRVINAGLSGSTVFGQDQMVMRGLAMDPDLVLLVYHENDIDEMANVRMWTLLEENRRLKSRFPVSVVYPVVRQSALWNLAQRVRRSRQRWPGQSAEMRGIAQPHDPIIESARKEYLGLLEAVADSLRERLIPFVFVLYPHPESVRKGTGGRDYAVIRSGAEDLSIPTLDLLDTLRASGRSVNELFLLPHDYHPTAAGHRTAASFIASRIQSGIADHKCARP